MGVAHRIAELYAAKMNAVLNRVSDPRELADYSYVELQDLLTEVHRGAAQVAASHERAERRVGELQHAADRLSEQAERAVQTGREDLARIPHLGSSIGTHSIGSFRLRFTPLS